MFSKVIIALALVSCSCVSAAPLEANQTKPQIAAALDETSHYFSMFYDKLAKFPVPTYDDVKNLAADMDYTGVIANKVQEMPATIQKVFKNVSDNFDAYITIGQKQLSSVFQNLKSLLDSPVSDLTPAEKDEIKDVQEVMETGEEVAKMLEQVLLSEEAETTTQVPTTEISQ